MILYRQESCSMVHIVHIARIWQFNLTVLNASVLLKLFNLFQNIQNFSNCGLRSSSWVQTERCWVCRFQYTSAICSGMRQFVSFGSVFHCLVRSVKIRPSNIICATWIPYTKQEYSVSWLQGGKQTVYNVRNADAASDTWMVKQTCVFTCCIRNLSNCKL